LHRGQRTSASPLFYFTCYRCIQEKWEVHILLIEMQLLAHKKSCDFFSYQKFWIILGYHDSVSRWR